MRQWSEVNQVRGKNKTKHTHYRRIKRSSDRTEKISWRKWKWRHKDGGSGYLKQGLCLICPKEKSWWNGVIKNQDLLNMKYWVITTWNKAGKPGSPVQVAKGVHVWFLLLVKEPANVTSLEMPSLLIPSKTVPLPFHICSIHPWFYSSDIYQPN